MSKNLIIGVGLLFAGIGILFAGSYVAELVSVWAKMPTMLVTLYCAFVANIAAGHYFDKWRKE